MPRHTTGLRLLAATAAFAAFLGNAGLAGAQPAPPPAPPPGGVDPAQLPEVKGVVARYTLTGRGDVDGFLLRDGTQVHVPPHLSTQLVYAVRPGDAVTIRGLKTLGAPLVNAVSVTNDAGGQTVLDAGGGPREARRSMDAQGRVQTALRGPRGEINGAMLENGTILRLPPREAERFAHLLRPGQTVAVRGDGLSGPLGTVIDARAIGPAADHLAEVAGPPHPPHEGRPRPPRD